MQGSLNVSVVNMRSLNPRLLNRSLLNSCFTAGELAPSKKRVQPVLLLNSVSMSVTENVVEMGIGQFPGKLWP